jgi:hypothetical protein
VVARNETPAPVFNSYMSSSFARARGILRFAFPLALFAVTACREAPLGFGPTPAAARRNGDEFLGAYSARYTNLTRPARFTYIRMNLGRGTLIPSRVFNDTLLWSARLGDTTRLLVYNGFFTGERYTYGLRANPERLEQLGDSYHSSRLRRRSRDEYEWTTTNDFHVGSMPPNALASVVSRALRATEELGGAGARANYRSGFPRSTAVLGRLYAVDSLRVVPDREGASTIWLTISADPERLRATHPSLADYLRKYIDRTNMRVTILDQRGARWLEMTLRQKQMHLRIRSRDGRFAPLEGPVRSLPDSLVMRSDFTTRILLFDVGWRNLLTDMTLVRGESDQAWQFRMTREPAWELPPLTGLFIRTPLRRPFAGAGVNFRIGFRTLPNGSTAMYRRGFLRVQESTIVRFLGRLSGQAMTDFYGRSELDENSFNGEVFAALRADIREILSD